MKEETSHDRRDTKHEIKQGNNNLDSIVEAAFRLLIPVTESHFAKLKSSGALTATGRTARIDCGLLAAPIS
jgi:hypothetical protein